MFFILLYRDNKLQTNGDGEIQKGRCSADKKASVA